MDGVLIDSQPYHFKADADTMKDYGINKDCSFFEPFAGTVTPERMSMLKKMFGINAEVDEMSDLRERMILDIMANEDIVSVKGIPKLLENIKDSGLKTAVASSSSYALIGLILKRLDIYKYFDSITSGVDVKNGKPAPDVFLLAAERLGVKPKDCIVVEDSEYGVEAGKRAGMKVVGYINPTSGKQCLDKADVITDDFEKIYLESIL